MNKTVLLLSACMVAPFAGSVDASESAARQRIARAGTQAAMIGPADRFTGQARVEPLFGADGDIAAAAAYVTFEPGARSAWHTHPAGQRLVVVSGMGLTQEWGQPIQELHPGDVVVCPAGVKHWHGAGPRTAMTHLAVTGSDDGKSVDWLEKVTDDEYNEVGLAPGL